MQINSSFPFGCRMAVKKESADAEAINFNLTSQRSISVELKIYRVEFISVNFIYVAAEAGIFSLLYYFHKLAMLKTV